MKRRDFIKGAALIVAAAGSGETLRAAVKMGTDEATDEGGPLVASAPMLQNFAETSIGIAFAVSALANGYVIYGERPDLSDGKKVKCGGFRVTEVTDKVSQVRLTGLKPATTYYYRIGADRIQYGGGYKMKNLGSYEDPTIYSFTTAGAKAEAHFCVINDTHVKWPTIEKLQQKILSIAPSCVIWNGDASNTEETIEAQMRIFIRPEGGPKDYAARIPYLLCPGNHDFRGWANRHLERVWMYRQAEERSSRDWDLGRNFAVRLGDLALIGLDTGEDKLDTNPLFAGIFNMAAYREAQALWLKDVLKRKDIASAPFKVAFCHIPLFDPRPDANPGDIAPADKDPRYKNDYAAWQRSCANLWTPLLSKAGCRLIISGHQHNYRRDDPSDGRKWTQLVGGGPKLSEKAFPTVIEGKVEGRELRITVHNMTTGAIQDSFSIKR